MKFSYHIAHDIYIKGTLHKQIPQIDCHVKESNITMLIGMPFFTNLTIHIVLSDLPKYMIHEYYLKKFHACFQWDDNLHITNVLAYHLPTFL